MKYFHGKKPIEVNKKQNINFELEIQSTLYKSNSEGPLKTVLIISIVSYRE